MLSTALITKLMRVPVHEDIDEIKQKKVGHLIVVITIMTVVPSTLIGASQVYQTVMEQNINNYLKNEFIFEETQVVQSESDILNHEISVSLVGTQISKDVLERLEQVLPKYNLEGYKLRITQNKIMESNDKEKVTIAVQENTIQDLQKQIEEKQKENDEMSTELSKRIDCKQLSESAVQIFDMLSSCYCGIMSGSEGEYILLVGTAEKVLAKKEEQILKNWLISETGMSKVKLQISY